jgi:hypothetical protein
MIDCRAFLLVLLLAVLPAPTFVMAADAPPALTAIAQWPATGTLRYSVRRGADGLVLGRITHEWQHDAQTYRLRAVTETTGIAALLKPSRSVQESHGEIVAGSLRPLEFRHEKKNGTEQAVFDWANETVSYRDEQVLVRHGVQDLLSMVYQLALVRGERGALSMTIASGTKLEEYRFEFIGRETMGSGEHARQVDHLKVVNGDQKIEFWVSPLLPAKSVAAQQETAPVLPWKIRVTDKHGDFLEQFVESAADLPAQ